jgi:hypothetical protein
MGPVMACTPYAARGRSRIGALAIAGVLVWAHTPIALAAQPTTTPTVPTPASAKVQPPGAGSTPAATATATTTTPTTTYAPSGGTTVPGGATVSTATTPPVAGVRATGAGAGGTPTAPAATTTAQTSNAKAKADKGDRPLSTGAIVIAALAALLVLGCVVWALARSSAFEPHWLLALRHSMAEAGFRASATWSEFADWARLGR